MSGDRGRGTSYQAHWNHPSFHLSLAPRHRKGGLGGPGKSAWPCICIASWPIDPLLPLRRRVFSSITGRDVNAGAVHFPGSQPVSLARDNLGLLQNRRYWLSWKADGTRYMMLILDRGCYLIDRSYKMVRLQVGRGWVRGQGRSWGGQEGPATPGLACSMRMRTTCPLNQLLLLAWAACMHACMPLS